MIGGEEQISSLWMTNGAVSEYAKIFNAMIFSIGTSVLWEELSNSVSVVLRD